MQYSTQFRNIIMHKEMKAVFSKAPNFTTVADQSQSGRHNTEVQINREQSDTLIVLTIGMAIFTHKQIFCVSMTID